MAGKLDTQGWIDATRNGRAYAFFLRNEILWVRRNGKYKRTQVSGIDTIAGARVLAGSIAAGDPGFRRGWNRCSRSRVRALLGHGDRLQTAGEPPRVESTRDLF
jgi:hypothetical protein